MKPYCTISSGDGGFNVNTDPVQLEDREAVCRVLNCILVLAKNSVMLYDTTILYAYEASTQYQVSTINRGNFPCK